MANSSWLSVSSAAKVIGVTPARVRQLAQSGRLPHEMTQIGRLFDPDVVANYRVERDAGRSSTRGAR